MKNICTHTSAPPPTILTILLLWCVCFVPKSQYKRKTKYKGWTEICL